MIYGGKQYQQSEIKEKFRKKKCLECDNGNLISNGRDGSGWVSLYNCDACNTRYAFLESDMGQTQPTLESNVW